MQEREGVHVTIEVNCNSQKSDDLHYFQLLRDFIYLKVYSSKGMKVEEL